MLEEKNGEKKFVEKPFRDVKRDRYGKSAFAVNIREEKRKEGSDRSGSEYARYRERDKERRRRHRRRHRCRHCDCVASFIVCFPFQSVLVRDRFTTEIRVKIDRRAHASLEVDTKAAFENLHEAI